MTKLLRLLTYVRVCYLAYRIVSQADDKNNGKGAMSYVTAKDPLSGIPTMTVHVATGREAWRVSIEAIHVNLTR